MVAASAALAQSPASSSSWAATRRARPASLVSSAWRCAAHSPGAAVAGPGPRTRESATRAAAAAPATLPASRRAVTSSIRLASSAASSQS
jgi:hypothetical protein